MVQSETSSGALDVVRSKFQGTLGRIKAVNMINYIEDPKVLSDQQHDEYVFAVKESRSEYKRSEYIIANSIEQVSELYPNAEAIWIEKPMPITR